MKHLLLIVFSLYTIGTSGQQFFQTTPASQRWVDKTFHKLTRRQKIGQLMVIRLSERRGKEIVFLEDQVTQYVKKYDIGAVCLFQGGSLQQAEALNRLQAKAKTPLMVCVDGETGLGMRFTDVTPFPDQLTLGAISDPKLAYEIGKAIGQQCKRAGVQVNYAPVVDINNNPNNPVINYRSLGEDKYKVSLLGSAIMKGMQDEGVMACAKHFPGHGDVSVDSHLDLPVINKSMQVLDSLELVPFKQLIKDGVGSMMIAHLYIPAIDTTKNQATSLSKKNVTGLLKETLGFKGLTFTDALEMKGVTKFYPAGLASVRSLIAGNDMLCLPGDLKVSIKKTRKAIRKHQLSWKEIDEKVHKVLLAKYNLGLEAWKPITYNALTEDLNKDVIRFKKAVYENAITLLRQNNPALLPLAASKKVAYIGIGISSPNSFASQLQENYKADCFYFDSSTDSIHAQNIISDLQSYDAVIIGIHQYNKFPANNFGISKALIDIANTIQKMRSSITFVFGNPYAIKNFVSAPNIVACYEDDSLMHDAAINLLKGTATAKGKFPVTVDTSYHFGCGIISKN